MYLYDIEVTLLSLLANCIGIENWFSMKLKERWDWVMVKSGQITNRLLVF